MTFVHLDCLHPKVWQPAFIHKEMDSRYEIPKIRIDTDIIVQGRFQMQNIVLIKLFINVLNRHLRIEEFIELCVALSVVTDSTFP